MPRFPDYVVQNGPGIGQTAQIHLDTSPFDSLTRLGEGISAFGQRWIEREKEQNAFDDGERYQAHRLAGDTALREAVAAMPPEARGFHDAFLTGRTAPDVAFLKTITPANRELYTGQLLADRQRHSQAAAQAEYNGRGRYEQDKFGETLALAGDEAGRDPAAMPALLDGLGQRLATMSSVAPERKAALLATAKQAMARAAWRGTFAGDPAGGASALGLIPATGPHLGPDTGLPVDPRFAALSFPDRQQLYNDAVTAQAEVRFKARTTQEPLPAPGAPAPPILAALRQQSDARQDDWVVSLAPTNPADPAQQARYVEAQRAVARLRAERKADPVAFLGRAYPDLRRQWQQVQQTGDPKTLSDAIAATAAHADSLDLPPEQRQLLPKPLANQAVLAFADSSKPVDQRFRAISNLVTATPDGEQQRAIFAQLADAGLPPKLGPALAATVRGDEGAAHRIAAAILTPPASGADRPLMARLVSTNFAGNGGDYPAAITLARRDLPASLRGDAFGGEPLPGLTRPGSAATLTGPDGRLYTPEQLALMDRDSVSTGAKGVTVAQNTDVPGHALSRALPESLPNGGSTPFNFKGALTSGFRDNPALEPLLESILSDSRNISAPYPESTIPRSYTLNSVLGTADITEDATRFLWDSSIRARKKQNSSDADIIHGESDLVDIFNRTIRDLFFHEGGKIPTGIVISYKSFDFIFAPPLEVNGPLRLMHARETPAPGDANFWPTALPPDPKSGHPQQASTQGQAPQSGSQISGYTLDENEVLQGPWGPLSRNAPGSDLYVDNKSGCYSFDPSTGTVTRINTDLAQRISRTGAAREKWIGGERGNGRYLSDNPDAFKITGEKGVEYKNGYPDFKPYSNADVDIGYISQNRNANFRAAAEFLLAHPELIQTLGIPQSPVIELTWTDIEKWRKDNGYSWHEVEDLKTLQLVPRIINSKYPHIGGVGEGKACLELKKER